MQREPWFHYWGSRNAVGRRAVFDVLTAAGIKLRPFDAHAVAGAGILCFSETNDQLYQFLREVSRNGDERVLAIPMDDALADGRQAWELLRAGASDVFVWSAGAGIPEQIKARFERWRDVVLG